MQNCIDTYSSIYESPLPDSLKNLLSQYCSFLHGIVSVPFAPMEQIIDVLEQSKMRVRQIVYLYSANDVYSLSQYSQPITSIWSPEGGYENTEGPNLFGYILHGSGAISLVAFIRGRITNTGVLQGVLQHYQMVANSLEQYGYVSHNELLFAGVGILPGLLNRLASKNKLTVPERVFRMNVLKNANSARLVAHAFREVSQVNGFTLNDCVILGAKGALGKEVSKYFLPPELNGPLCIDIENKSTFPHNEKPLLILDCTGGGSLEDYLEFVSSGSIWLNESYPPPKEQLCFLAKQKGIRMMHILGVKGLMIPPLSGLYKNGIPCCASLPEDSSDQVTVIDI